ncbi:ABC transporter permease [Microbacterium sp. MYb62]|uniref:ABC transporter permease n=1 Tax=Microbacterium sp. MYb62 TaxID=1848690 RepID=UPI001C6148F7|nr:ABC transporter permease [Microbacterium sp. MYb62]
MPRPVLVVGFGLAVLSFWQLSIVVFDIPSLILPTPAEVASDLVFVIGSIFTGGSFLSATTVTIIEVILGFAIAAAVGLALGVIVGSTDFGNRAVMPYVVALDTMPKVAFAPLFVAWFGFDLESKYLMAAFIAFFPITVNTATGLAATDQGMKMLFRSLEASRWQTLTKLQLPHALPYIFAGLKLASVASVTGVVFAEYMGGGEGLGELVRVAASQLMVDRVFSLIVILSLMGLLLFGLMVLLERRFASWDRSDS